MKKLRQIAVIMILALAIVSVLSPSDRIKAAGGLKLVVATVDGEPGKEVKVTVSISENPGICALRIGITYDSQLTLTAADNGTLFSDKVFGNQLSANPYYLTWDESLNTSDNTECGVLATLTFKVDENATSGLYKIGATCRIGDVYNIDLVDRGKLL